MKLIMKISNLILSTFAIYQTQEYSLRQSCTAEPGMPKIGK